MIRIIILAISLFLSFHAPLQGAQLSNLDTDSKASEEQHFQRLENEKDSQEKPQIADSYSNNALFQPSLGLDQFQKMVPQIWEPIKRGVGKELCLFLGTSGAGKSTTVNYLMGVSFEAIEGSRGKFRIASNQHFQKIAKMADNNFESFTTWPECFEEKEYKLTLCDFPGFDDKRGIEQQYINVLSSKGIIHQSKGVKAIIFVISKGELSSNKGTAFTEMMIALSLLLDNPEKYIDSIYFAFTEKERSNGEAWDIEDFLDQIEEHLENLQKEATDLFPSLNNDDIWKKVDQTTAWQEVYELFKSHLSVQDKTKFMKKEKIYEPLAMKMKIYIFLNTITKDRYKNHSFVIYPTQKGTIRRKILGELEKSKPIPKNLFKFVGTSSIKDSIFYLYTKIAKEGLKEIKKYEKACDEIIQNKDQCNALTKKIEILKKTEENTRQELQQLEKESRKKYLEEKKLEKITSLDSEYDSINQENSRKDKEIKAIDEETKGLDTDEVVLMKELGPYIDFEGKHHTCLYYRWRKTISLPSQFVIDRIEVQAYDAKNTSKVFSDNRVQSFSKVYPASLESIFEEKFLGEDTYAYELRCQISTKNPVLKVRVFVQKSEFFEKKIRESEEKKDKIWEEKRIQDEKTIENHLHVLSLLSNTTDILVENSKELAEKSEKKKHLNEAIKQLDQKLKIIEKQIAQKDHIFSLIAKTHHFVVMGKGTIQDFGKQYDKFRLNAINIHNDQPHEENDEKKEYE